VIDESRLRACLASSWALPDARVEVNDGGMGSATRLVSQAGRRWVAKAVTPALRAPFAGGLSVATLLDEAGIPAGAPVPTLDGRSLVDLDTASLALLTWVEGEPLTGSGADERQVIGETLALAHQALQGAAVPGARRFHWVRPDADHLALRPWIRPAVTDAVAALDRLNPASLTGGRPRPPRPAQVPLGGPSRLLRPADRQPRPDRQHRPRRQPEGPEDARLRLSGGRGGPTQCRRRAGRR
jgi:homoserine kinase type II